MPWSKKMRRVILHDTSSAFPPLAKGGRGDLGQSCAGQALQNPPPIPLLQRGKAELGNVGIQATRTYRPTHPCELDAGNPCRHDDYLCNGYFDTMPYTLSN